MVLANNLVSCHFELIFSVTRRREPQSHCDRGCRFSMGNSIWLCESVYAASPIRHKSSWRARRRPGAVEYRRTRSEQQFHISASTQKRGSRGNNDLQEERDRQYEAAIHSRVKEKRFSIPDICITRSGNDRTTRDSRTVAELNSEQTQPRTTIAEGRVGASSNACTLPNTPGPSPRCPPASPSNRSSGHASDTRLKKHSDEEYAGGLSTVSDVDEQDTVGDLPISPRQRSN